MGLYPEDLGTLYQDVPGRDARPGLRGLDGTHVRPGRIEGLPLSVEAFPKNAKRHRIYIPEFGTPDNDRIILSKSEKPLKPDEAKELSNDLRKAVNALPHLRDVVQKTVTDFIKSIRTGEP